MRIERRTQRSSGIVRRGMHEHAIEEARAENFSVHRGVVRHPARQAQVRLPVAVLKCRNVSNTIVSSVSCRLAARSLCTWVNGSRVLPGREDVVQQRHPHQKQFEGAFGVERVQLAEEVTIWCGIAVRRQPHHLVFLEHVVAEEADHFAVQVSERVALGNRSQPVERPVPGLEDQPGVALARAVDA